METLIFNNQQLAALERGKIRLSFSDEELEDFLELLKRSSFEEQEVLLCGIDPAYFVLEYLQIYDIQTMGWIPAGLWPTQIDIFDILKRCDYNEFDIILSRQCPDEIWIGLAYRLWQMLFRPGTTAMFFSKHGNEAIYLLGEERLRGMYKRLPDWMHVSEIIIDLPYQWQLSNGSIAYAFPPQAGDDFVITCAVSSEEAINPDETYMVVMNKTGTTLDSVSDTIKVLKRAQSRSDWEKKHKPAAHILTQYVYLLRADNGLIKIGKTNDISKRKKALSTMIPMETELIGFKQDLFAGDLEKLLHKVFSDKRIRGEWFRLSADDVDKIKRDYGFSSPSDSLKNKTKTS